ncbi:CsbD family protein [Acerihabitans sp. KWT182]|uniref:CsbD family protein n=1 Tax=Acerihabitans sp. KWT182 TaxID=3157919 RepID=A0AAU7Q5B9_9GAMM
MFEKAKDKAQEAAGKGQEALGKATGDNAMNLEGKVRKHAAQACFSVNDCIDTIKAKTIDDPIPALLVAGGVGFLLAKILRPRHR